MRISNCHCSVVLATCGICSKETKKNHRTWEVHVTGHIGGGRFSLISNQKLMDPVAFLFQ